MQETHNVSEMSDSDLLEYYNYHKRQQQLNDSGQMVRKILLNSGYGALSNVYFCLYDLRLARSITTSGQLSVRLSAIKANDRLNNLLGGEPKNRIIYSDTDSNYMILKDIVDKCGMTDAPTNDIVDFLDRFYEEKMRPSIELGYSELAEYTKAFVNKMEMSRETISDNSVFVSKKRYTMSVLDMEGVRFTEPYIKTMGMDLVKSSTPAVCRTAMKEVVRMLLNSTEEEIHTFVTEFKKTYFQLPPDAIARIAGTKKLEETYCNANGGFLNNVTVPINSRAAIMYNNELKNMDLDQYEVIHNGDKIKYVFLEDPNRLQTHVIGFVDILPPEFNLHHKIDYKQMFFKTFVKSMDDILGLIGWELEPTPNLEQMFI